jgi:biotin synthase
MEKVKLLSAPDETYADRIFKNAEKKLLIERSSLEESELLELSRIAPFRLKDLGELAHRVRLSYLGNTVEIEGILSVKTGGCPEDCKFCSQSAKYQTGVSPIAFLDDEVILKAALETKETGATEFCLVLAVRGPSERIMLRLEQVIPFLINKTGLNIAVSAGILNEDYAARLKACGCHRYNHNLETAKSFFPEIVTTHTWDERYETCLLVKNFDMELCCGLLFNMGESDEQRIEALCQVRSLSPNEVPINFLNPRPGTPLGRSSVMQAKEALAWIAISRLAMPGVILRYAGGREITLKDLQSAGMESGINALIVGNYLTTLGRAPEEDLAMLESLRMPIGALKAVF